MRAQINPCLLACKQGLLAHEYVRAHIPSRTRLTICMRAHSQPHSRTHVAHKRRRATDGLQEGEAGSAREDEGHYSYAMMMGDSREGQGEQNGETGDDCAGAAELMSEGGGGRKEGGERMELEQGAAEGMSVGGGGRLCGGDQDQGGEDQGATVMDVQGSCGPAVGWAGEVQGSAHHREGGGGNGVGVSGVRGGGDCPPPRQRRRTAHEGGYSLSQGGCGYGGGGVSGGRGEGEGGSSVGAGGGVSSRAGVVRGIGGRCGGVGGHSGGVHAEAVLSRREEGCVRGGGSRLRGSGVGCGAPDGGAWGALVEENGDNGVVVGRGAGGGGGLQGAFMRSGSVGTFMGVLASGGGGTASAGDASHGGAALGPGACHCCVLL